jgi:thioredoxin reductase
MAYDYDMVVIGAGPAGLTGAGMSAVLGGKAALMKAHRLGGDCTWYGCIPTLAFLWKQLTNLRIEPAIPRIEAFNGRTRSVVYIAAGPFALVNDFD